MFLRSAFVDRRRRRRAGAAIRAAGWQDFKWPDWPVRGGRCSHILDLKYSCMRETSTRERAQKLREGKNQLATYPIVETLRTPALVRRRTFFSTFVY